LETAFPFLQTAMEWDDLKHFLAVARSGSLSEAALALNTSPSTVSRRIGALEKKLGVRLFDHKSSGYSLTESGVDIRQKAEDVEAAVLSVERAALGRDMQATGVVRVTASDDIAANLIAPQLGYFHARHPNISLEIIAQMELADLTRREADIAVRGSRPARGHFVVRRAGNWHFGLYASRKYAEAHQLKPGLRDLSAVSIITWTKQWSHLRGGPWFAEYARGAKVALASDSRRVHHAACKAGLGVAILPCALAEKESELICLLPPKEVLSLELWLIVHRDLARTARVRAVMDFLFETVSKHAR
jgi:DNA-binding transcriptional LysR family regulator